MTLRRSGFGALALFMVFELGVSIAEASPEHPVTRVGNSTWLGGVPPMKDQLALVNRAHHWHLLPRQGWELSGAPDPHSFIYPNGAIHHHSVRFGEESLLPVVEAELIARYDRIIGRQSTAERQASLSVGVERERERTEAAQGRARAAAISESYWSLVMKGPAGAAAARELAKGLSSIPFPANWGPTMREQARNLANDAFFSSPEAKQRIADVEAQRWSIRQSGY